ncbi:MAG: putative Isoleucine-tRNA ligase [Streblomastix strix]|uniref:Putative Isoleucine-tRNA ligase n=1 Tax=Streblomastix strix TaxID=222440 RepID=A0A5J4WT90_9EUKA|nr:MAG: putative Isoleucine-tRNA ligase [Streblomastix strix]
MLLLYIDAYQDVVKKQWLKKPTDAERKVTIKQYIEKILPTVPIFWVPIKFKNSRFGVWVKDAKDWTISRNRFWGTPLPFWEREIEVKEENINSLHVYHICVRSIAELEELTCVKRITDFHRDAVDDMEIKYQKEAWKKFHLIKAIFDCWFESVSMPFGQLHYTFENKDVFAN